MLALLCLRTEQPSGRGFPLGVVETAPLLYFTSDGQNRVYKVAVSGGITTVAGSGARGFGGDGGSALTAQLNSPHGIALDATGNLYIADYSNHRVRKITVAGVITTIAGNGSAGGSGDGGPAISAQLNLPRGIAVDSTGNVFIADSGNNRVRKVTPAGIISTVAGNGIASFSGDGGPATAAAIWVPTDVAVDASSGSLYRADGGNHRVRKVLSTGVISTVAGSGTPGFSGDGGPSTAAQLNSPYSIDVDAAGNLYIADRGNYRIRRVAGGVINTIAGLGNPGFTFSGDGGPATSALFNLPEGIAVDTIGNIFVADTGNNRVRLFTLGGFINAVAGRSALQASAETMARPLPDAERPRNRRGCRLGTSSLPTRFNNRIRKVTQGGVINTPSPAADPSLSAGTMALP
jgi:sugar lactone lactonase YvrE